MRGVLRCLETTKKPPLWLSCMSKGSCYAIRVPKVFPKSNLISMKLSRFMHQAKRIVGNAPKYHYRIDMSLGGI